MGVCEAIHDQVLFSGLSVLFEYLYSPCLKVSNHTVKVRNGGGSKESLVRGNGGSPREEERGCSDGQKAYEQ